MEWISTPASYYKILLARLKRLGARKFASPAKFEIGLPLAKNNGIDLLLYLEVEELICDWRDGPAPELET